jgi:hypothetical protein
MEDAYNEGVPRKPKPLPLPELPHCKRRFDAILTALLAVKKETFLTVGGRVVDVKEVFLRLVGVEEYGERIGPRLHQHEIHRLQILPATEEQVSIMHQLAPLLCHLESIIWRNTLSDASTSESGSFGSFHKSHVFGL